MNILEVQRKCHDGTAEKASGSPRGALRVTAAKRDRPVSGVVGSGTASL